MRHFAGRDQWAADGREEVVILDNRDSFVFNLAHRFAEIGVTAGVCRSDEVGLERLDALEPSALVISPGPGGPEDAGISVDAVGRFSGRIPILGVCLGHQAIVVAFGGRVAENRAPVHGRATPIQHDGTVLFEGVEKEISVGRYHSLTAVEPLPEDLVVTARGSGQVMALRHREHATFGVQFHPESVLTPSGHDVLRNFVRLGL